VKSVLSPGIALAFISGALAASSFAPLRWWWLAWLALAPLYVALNVAMNGQVRILRSAGIGFSFGLGLFLVGMYWMTEVGFFAWPTLSLIQAVPFALFGAAFGFLNKSSEDRAVTGGLAFLLRPVLFASLYVLLEWGRTQGKYAFPWFPLAATQVSVPALLQIISVTGQWGLTFAIALCGALVGEAHLRRFLAWSAALQPMAIAVALFALVGIFGEVRLWWVRDWLRDESDQPVLRVGITQYGQGAGDDIFDVYQQLSRRLVTAPDSEQPPVLILWPEGVAPPDIRNNFYPRETLTQFARSSRVSLLIGSDALDNRGRYTSAVLIDDRGQIAGRYDKIQLVPMGEFFLFRPLLKMVTDRYIPEEDKVAGDKPGVLNVPRSSLPSARAGTIICYESAFPNRVRTTVAAGAQCITLITDDETFGTTAGPYQHADFAVLRAVETYRYLIRAAHTGTSRIIDPTGNIMKSLPLMERGVLTGDIILRDDITFYVRWGDWLVFLCGGMVAAAVIYRFSGRKTGRATCNPDLPA
jgi:apolipoprotein N-acyltransferase